jgi:hypothetical protein
MPLCCKDGSDQRPAPAPFKSIAAFLKRFPSAEYRLLVKTFQVDSNVAVLDAEIAHEPLGQHYNGCLGFRAGFVGPSGLLAMTTRLLCENASRRDVSVVSIYQIHHKSNYDLALTWIAFGDHKG